MAFWTVMTTAPNPIQSFIIPRLQETICTPTHTRQVPGSAARPLEISIPAFRYPPNQVINSLYLIEFIGGTAGHRIRTLSACLCGENIFLRIVRAQNRPRKSVDFSEYLRTPSDRRCANIDSPTWHRIINQECPARGRISSQPR